MADRDTSTRPGDFITTPVAAATKLESGKIGCANAAGYAVEGSTNPGLTALGRIEKTVDNSAGAAGDLKAEIRRGIFKFANSATDPVTQASLGKTVYVEDDETVAATDGAAGEDPATKSACGKCIELADDGVWVEIR